MLRKIIEDIIEAHGKSGVRWFNHMRTTLTVLGPGFIYAGLSGLIGFGQWRSNGEVVEGPDYIGSSFFLIIGIISLILRLTFFKDKRMFE